MSLDEVTAAWVAAATVHGRATELGDYRTGNPQARVIIAACAELRRRGVDAQAQILAQLEHPEPAVRASAAAEALAFAPERAVEVLEAVAAIPRSLVAFTACHALRMWHRGRFQPASWGDEIAPAS